MSAFSKYKPTAANTHRALATLWTLLILAALSVPGGNLPQSGLPGIDKFAHFALFAGLGGLWMHALGAPPRVRARRVLLAGGSFAILLEVYQGLVPFLGRSPGPLDAVAGVAGLLLTVGLYSWWLRRSSD